MSEKVSCEKSVLVLSVFEVYYTRFYHTFSGFSPS